MRLRLFQVDAFADRVFTGNPAAVVPLESWLEDATLQAIAGENNLSETAYFVPEDGGYHLRWFTPTREVDLCGHATLASAHVLFHHLGATDEVLRFRSQGGDLRVRRDGDLLELDFPEHRPTACTTPPGFSALLGADPDEVLLAREIPAGRIYLARLADEAAVRSLTPDPAGFEPAGVLNLMVTAPGEDADFVSRYFAPGSGIDEDPVTGSAHCTLAPYWAARLGRSSLTAFQASARGGHLRCRLVDGRVLIAGHATMYLQGEIDI